MTEEPAREKAETLQFLFGPSAGYIGVTKEILPRLVTHRYRFIPQALFDQWLLEKKLSAADINKILVSELLDNAHLAATTALIRTEQWVDAVCVSYERGNYVAWAGSTRALIEGSGDIGDGLLQIPGFLAEHHSAFSQALAGACTADLMDLREVEERLAHYIRAGKTADKSDGTPKPKPTIDYVHWIETANVPGVKKLYYKLCGITHPASGSINYLYKNDIDGLRLDIDRGKTAIDEIHREFPDVLAQSLSLACNNAILILRVLHKFGRHPKLPELKRLDWSQIKIWSKLEPLLR